MSPFMQYSCGLAICDTYVLPGNLYWLSNVCSVCGKAGFSTVLKRCSELHCLWVRTILSCLSTKYSSDCGLSGRQRRSLCSFSCSYFFPSWENCIGWLCFSCICMFVVLPLLVASVLQQMWHTGSPRFSGSPQSFGLNQMCSYTEAVAFGFETNSIFVFIPSNLTLTSVTSGLLLLTGLSCCTLCYVRGPVSPHRDREWLTGGFTWETRGKQTSMQMEIVEAGKIIEVIFIYRTINWFIDYRDRPKCMCTLSADKCHLYLRLT